jgi:hypothetical protein
LAEGKERREYGRRERKCGQKSGGEENGRV